MNKILAYLHVVLFVGATATLGVLFLVLPKNEVSEVEKRKLSPLPRYTLTKLLNGKYTDSLDKYVADNFPWREEMVSLSFAMKDLRGFKNNDVKIYHDEKPAQDTVGLADTLDMEPVMEAWAADDSVAEKGVPGYETHSLFIANGMALQLFGGNRSIAKKFARVVNKYAETLGEDVNVYCLVAPTAGEYYLPSKYSRMKNSEKDNIKFIYDSLSANVKPVDAYSVLRRHKDEYIFFNTDHHWTGLGAYYGYEAWCKAAGIKAVPKDSMPQRNIKGFLGSLYWKTRDPILEENMDSVDYFIPKVKTQTTICTQERPSVEVKADYLVQFAKGVNAYGVFLGSDYPFIRIKTDKNNGKKVIIIKNSYGNPFATFFVNHFETVFVIDYRYYRGSIKQLVEKEGVTDVVIIHGSFSANTIWHVNQTLAILNGGGGVRRPKPEESPEKKEAQPDSANAEAPKPRSEKEENEKTKEPEKPER